MRTSGQVLGRSERVGAVSIYTGVQCWLAEMFNVGKPSPAPCRARSIDRSGRVGRSGVEWPVQRRPPNSQSGESDNITGHMHMHMQPAAAAQATLYHPCRRVLANVVWVASVGLSLSQVAGIDSSSSIMFRAGFGFSTSIFGASIWDGGRLTGFRFPRDAGVDQ